MEIDYKLHHIISAAWQIRDTTRWKPHVAVICPEEGDGSHPIRRPVIEADFASEQEAEFEGIKFAQSWIDASKLNLP